MKSEVYLYCEDNDENVIAVPRSQFDSCPGCGTVILCRPCQWLAAGETVAEATENWNRRATSSEWVRIETIDDLPKEGYRCFWRDRCGNVDYFSLNTYVCGIDYYVRNYSAWMPIPPYQLSEDVKRGEK